MKSSEIGDILYMIKSSIDQYERKISLLLPTRGRPHLLKRFFQSIIDNTQDLKNVEIIMCLDDDDPQSHGIDNSKLNIVKLIGARSTMGDYNTKCLNHSSGNIIILMNDDLTICTPGWDKIISDFALTIPDGIFLAYPNDKEAGRHMCTFPIMSRKTCEILSNPYPKEYDALYIDVHIFDVFTRLKHIGYDRMFYLENVIFDHRHFINSRVRSDAGYSHKNRFKDAMAFISLRNLRQASAQRLLSTIEDRPLPKLPNHLIIEVQPDNLIHAFMKYSSIFLTDYGLPLGWRLLWFVRFTKYYAAMKSGLNFLKRKSYSLYGSG